MQHAKEPRVNFSSTGFNIKQFYLVFTFRLSVVYVCPNKHKTFALTKLTVGF
jgi:hypothetical protein